MVKLSYNLDEIKEFGYEPGRARAKLQSVKKQKSRSGKPMLVFEWKILTGENKGNKISSYCSLQENALSNLKQHLEAMGLKGKVNKSSDDLIGRQVVLVISEQNSSDGSDRSFVGVSRVLPKNAPLTSREDDDEDEDDDDFDEEDEDDEDYEDDEEDEDEDDDEDWDD